MTDLGVYVPEPGLTDCVQSQWIVLGWLPDSDQSDFDAVVA